MPQGLDRHCHQQAMSEWEGSVATPAGILVGGVMIIVGKKAFGGVNGDVFGATNEIARMAALLVLVF